MGQPGLGTNRQTQRMCLLLGMEAEAASERSECECLKWLLSPLLFQQPWYSPFDKQLNVPVAVSYCKPCSCVYRYNFLMYVPYQLERLIQFGTLLCLDSFLAIMTIMPYRAVVALIAICRGAFSG